MASAAVIKKLNGTAVAIPDTATAQLSVFIREAAVKSALRAKPNAEVARQVVGRTGNPAKKVPAGKDVTILHKFSVSSQSEQRFDAVECIESYSAESLKIMRDVDHKIAVAGSYICLLYTSPSPRD